MDCPGCGRTLRIPESKRGTIRPCPACATMITIPEVGEDGEESRVHSKTGGPLATKRRLDTARLAKFGDPEKTPLPDGVRRGRLPSTARVDESRLSTDGAARGETDKRKKPDTSRRTKKREKATRRRQKDSGAEGDSKEESAPRPFDPGDWGMTARGLGILGLAELITLTCILLQLPVLSTVMRSMMTGENTELASALSSEMMMKLVTAVRIVGGLGALGAIAGLSLCILSRSDAISKLLAILALVLRGLATLSLYDAVISSNVTSALAALAAYFASVSVVSGLLWRIGFVLSDPALVKSARAHLVSIALLIAIVGGLARRARVLLPEEADTTISGAVLLTIAFVLLAWLFAYAYLAGQGMRSIHRAGTIARARGALTTLSA